MLQMPPVFTFLSSLHVFSCLRTICSISFVMWLTHPALFPFLWLFRPLTQLHPSWLLVQKTTLETSRSWPVPSDMVLLRQRENNPVTPMPPESPVCPSNEPLLLCSWIMFLALTCLFHMKSVALLFLSPANRSQDIKIVVVRFRKKCFLKNPESF